MTAGSTVDREIRADHDRDTIVVYQAYGPAIARPALAAQRFVPPFSTGRMTWIKPSFRWLMHRRPGQAPAPPGAGLSPAARPRPPARHALSRRNRRFSSRRRSPALR
ncbi:DUF4291 family protein [Actinomadura craniellae]|uniref:DUF4291 family protein n=1 Tax=Actinomadura craniellae TaxID=2231787 RepID=UPI0018F1B876|nr:DUF4291 family protein [Actinomadura craniellae]